MRVDPTQSMLEADFAMSPEHVLGAETKPYSLTIVAKCSVICKTIAAIPPCSAKLARGGL